ncbi:MAG: six-cysteine peptide SCIFF [Firmicutes bacterium]|nr:six-cysteine peptide SCIFF [Bacillota bacterium]
MARHIQLVKRGNLQEIDSGNCRECQASCQSACKTSCTVGNQPCRQQQKRE